MAHLQNGLIELSTEDRESLKGENRLNVKNLMNKIIWGNKEHYYDKNLTEKTYVRT